jgi:Fe2+ or Zn2+ uptake regulation protein
MFARVLQLFLEKQLVKKLTSTTDKVIYFKETIFQGSSSKHLFTSLNRVEIS